MRLALASDADADADDDGAASRALGGIWWSAPYFSITCGWLSGAPTQEKERSLAALLPLLPLLLLLLLLLPSPPLLLLAMVLLLSALSLGGVAIVDDRVMTPGMQ